ncbi:hypothetical protein SFRURICE_008490 [Spodoptera frugiperda]|nr:hypothetical protein SFRURICE_008490 [Spodoptera frugiperda]
MSNPGLSPFGRSQLLRRSPPPTPSPAEQHQLRDPEPPASSEHEGRQDIADSIKEIKKAVETDRNTGSISYANVVKKGENLVRPANLQSIAIYPADKTQSSDDTKTLVQKIISPEELKLRVRGMKKIRNGGVIISADSKGDIEKLKASEKLVSSGLKVEEPSKRRPRIAVIGVPVALTEKEVLDCIFEQNLSEKLANTSRESFLEEIKVSHKSGKKDRPTYKHDKI